MAIDLNSRGTAKANAYRPDIDGLRAVAVLLVVFFHAGFAPASGGFVGVDIFFVISGYLITGIIVRELDDGHFSLANFYARRIRRICPALFAVLAVSSLAAFLLLIPNDLRNFGRSLVSTVLFYSNWNFYTEVGYFDGPAIDKPLLHTWSLAIEEQFYFLWPITVFGLYRAFGRKALPYVIVAVLVASLAASQIILEFGQAQAFYLLPYRAWELLLGALLAVASFPAISKLAANAAGVAGLAAIAYAASALDRATPFPGLNALFPCLGAAMLIAAGRSEPALSRRVLSFGPLQFVGRISYSLYLIHWPAFSFAHLFLDRPLLPEERIAVIVVSMIAAALSYRYIETPARQARLAFPALLGAVVPAAAMLTLWGAVYHGANGFPGRMPKGVLEAIAAPRESGASDISCRDVEVPAVGKHFCAIGASGSDGQYDFILWGDSHADHLTGAFADQARSLGLSGLVVWLPECPPFLNETGGAKACHDHNESVQRWIRTQRRLKTVFLAGVWSAYVKASRLTAPPKQDTGSAGNSRVGLRDTVNLLRSLNINFAIVEDVPTFPLRVPDCMARARLFGRSDERCFIFRRYDVERDSDKVSSILREISRPYGAPIVQTVHAFCEEDTCWTKRDGTLLYRDSHHLSNVGAHYLGSRMNIPWPATQAVLGEAVGMEASKREQ